MRNNNLLVTTLVILQNSTNKKGVRLVYKHLGEKNRVLEVVDDVAKQTHNNVYNLYVSIITCL